MFYTILSFHIQTEAIRANVGNEKTLISIGVINDIERKQKPAKTPDSTPETSALARLRYAPNQ